PSPTVRVVERNEDSRFQSDTWTLNVRRPRGRGSGGYFRTLRTLLHELEHTVQHAGLLATVAARFGTPAQVTQWAGDGANVHVVRWAWRHRLSPGDPRHQAGVLWWKCTYGSGVAHGRNAEDELEAIDLRTAYASYDRLLAGGTDTDEA